ncbi:thiamin pyrophosphokinase 1 [Stomoxys calcitrans]|uniref:Thiamin pyrophosphokinase thiamin-binding domain-containing protein n=1 Tax=Stomoxys calcitrans TaxID=35570 RepID=A0A1I8Q7U0_STOCA|nr:thiamin pyrophosphokinase 1 [Stomoxys calcitrans]
MVDHFGKLNGGTVPLELHYNWQPSNILNDPFRTDRGHGCLVLNREIKIPPHVVRALWENASLRCCVDGGANRWLHFLTSEINQEYSLKLPDLITGDFDSITAETTDYFAKRDIKQMHTPDQNHTDFSKAVDIIKPLLTKQKLQDIVVFHDTSGRFDQIMANVNTLFTRYDERCRIFLLGSCALSWLLKPGKHSISIPSHLVKDKRWCSLIPVGHEATNVTTSGLKWNLNNGSLRFGGMVSSSNTYSCTEVEIETNSELVWSMGVFSFNDD